MADEPENCFKIDDSDEEDEQKPSTQSSSLAAASLDEDLSFEEPAREHPQSCYHRLPAPNDLVLLNSFPYFFRVRQAPPTGFLAKLWSSSQPKKAEDTTRYLVFHEGQILQIKWLGPVQRKYGIFGPTKTSKGCPDQGFDSRVEMSYELFDLDQVLFASYKQLQQRK